MMRKAMLPIAGFLFVSVLPMPLAAQFQSPDLTGGKKSLKTILILPPETSLVKSGMKGAEPLLAESQALGSGLSSLVSQALKDKGCTILPDEFTSDALDRNPDLKYALSDLQTRYDKLQILLAKKPKGVRTDRFSLGDEVANFSPGAAADGLVFVRAKGFVPTTGLKTFVVLTGMGVTYSRVWLDISLVDAQSGTILYFAKPSVSGNFIDSQDGLKQAIDKSLSAFLLPLPAKK